MNKEIRKKIEEIATPICGEIGCELFLVEYTAAGRNSLLRVYIDREGGVSVEDCRRVSEALSVQLDVEDLIPHAYRLEVSSPGLDRPIRGPRDFPRYVGRKVKIVTRKAIGNRGQTTFSGTLIAYENETATVRAAGGDVRIAQHNIKRANLEFEMGSLP